MTREELLKELHSIHVGVSLVALTSEGALECTCVTPVGTSYEWMGLDEWKWPTYKISLPVEHKLQEIQEKLSRTSLLEEDIVNTELESLYFCCVPEEERSSERLNEFFLKLISFVSPTNRIVFVLFDDIVANFFVEYESLEAAFSDYWNVTPWEEYSDDSLKEILSQIEDGYDEIPLISFDSGDDET